MSVELSDRSFSAIEFVPNFETENHSTFKFSISPNMQISSLSYGFALDRPDARGGAENLTLNILMIPSIAPLVGQFIDNFAWRINKVHNLFNKDPENKDAIKKEVIELRIFISQIILAYEEIYGTTELEVTQG